MDEAFPIDVVMPWVDGSDPGHRAELERRWPWQPWLQPARYRFRDNGELRYALRSIQLNMPWVRTIHLVTNGQAPRWLDLEHPKVNLVTHDLFFERPERLPVFSSSAIEANLHRIGQAGVARHFLLFNDDFFVGQPVDRGEYVGADGGKRLHALQCGLPAFRFGVDRYQHTLAFNNLLLSVAFRRRKWAYPAHVPLLMDIEDLDWLHRRFRVWLRRTAGHRFRQRTDALARILYINAVPERDRNRSSGARLVRLDREHVIPLRDDVQFDMALARLVERSPQFFCLNDEIEDHARAAIRAIEMRTALETIFPDPAPFELDRLRQPLTIVRP